MCKKPACLALLLLLLLFLVIVVAAAAAYRDCCCAFGLTKYYYKLKLPCADILQLAPAILRDATATEAAALLAALLLLGNIVSRIISSRATV